MWDLFYQDMLFLRKNGEAPTVNILTAKERERLETHKKLKEAFKRYLPELKKEEERFKLTLPGDQNYSTLLEQTIKDVEQRIQNYV